MMGIYSDFTAGGVFERLILTRVLQLLSNEPPEPKRWSEGVEGFASI